MNSSVNRAHAHPLPFSRSAAFRQIVEDFCSLDSGTSQNYVNPAQQDLLSGLPIAERIQEGLRDYKENRHSQSSCLVRMARRRLFKAGRIEASQQHDIHAELDLYHLLSHEGNQAHSRYNALVRELISFARIGPSPCEPRISVKTEN